MTAMCADAEPWEPLMAVGGHLDLGRIGRAWQANLSLRL